MLRELAPALWVAEAPQQFLGVQLGARMTVLRLSGGGLFIHSPIALDNALQAELAKVGEVSFVVGPNLLHHLHLGEFSAAYPRAQVYGSPTLIKKRGDLHFHGVLGDAPPPEWAGQIDQLPFPARFLDETVFFHPATRTLIVTDLASNIQRAARLFDRILLRLDGAYRNFAVPRAIKLPIRLRYRRAASAAIDSIMRWDFDRVIMAHGEVLESGGWAAMRRAYSFL